MAVPNPVTPAPRRPTSPPLLPRADIYESDEQMLLLIDLPGVSRDHLELRVERGLLFIEATRPGGEGAPTERLQRVVALQRRVDADGIEASLQDGVLRVTLPRASADRPRRVPVLEA